jgi:D-amino-acid oxidase
MPGDYDIEYASPFAGANMLPYATSSCHQMPCVILTYYSMSVNENSRWERRTWPELRRLAQEVPEAGIHFQSL